MKRIYLDHSATTHVDTRVLEAMLPYFTENFGNASSLHSFGQEAAEALAKSREQVAVALGAAPQEIFFTSGGTESDNMAIKGAAYMHSLRGRHIITSVIEHPAVLRTCEELEREGFEITYVPVDGEGILDIHFLEDSIRDDTILISIMHANNEIGTIQPIKEINELISGRKIILHTDAVQSVGKIPTDVNELGVDMLSVSSHKLHGPKGVGALYVRSGVNIRPLVQGGGHERGLRPGTENIPGIVGFAKAMSIAREQLEEDSMHMQHLRDSMIENVLSKIAHVRLNGHDKKRLPNNVNMSFRHVEGESLLMLLDMNGVAVSTGSACSSTSQKASHVLTAIDLGVDYIHGSLRFTLGRENTMEEIDHVVDLLEEAVMKLRQISPFEEGV
ncbi:cysteine desulfurase NifS [uncultured Methanomethylovorans sp.]|uniref:cysteine desulfurase NifS n=1 Tax=uncultured Methanomethylovorans sp. TaxID=183759 RepID=UPI002AA61181|nr:cysteine desulfurase NifS [uncultured Methanomethylovorans sp.]